MLTPTPRQIEIRDHPELDLRVIAPAGCGKTEALALRIQGLLRRGTVVAPRKVLVTTFSNRARDNIRERLGSYLSPAELRHRVTVSNFHGLSARIFRAHASVIGLDPEMLLPENDWVGDILRARGVDFNEQGRVQEAFRSIKQDAADDVEVMKRLRLNRNQLAIEIEELRVSENRLTYDDLPRLAELVLQNDEVAELYRQHFGAVVVDEFQDLTPQQLRIVSRIGYKKTTYAGDLAQGIYGFAGARPAEVDAAVKAECGTEIAFNESHRSSPAVLQVVNALAPLTGGQTLVAADSASWPSGGMAGVVRFASPEDEAQWAVMFAKSVLMRAPGQRIGVVGRTSSRRRFADAAFAKSDVPFFRWDDGVMDTDVAKLMKSFLKRLDVAALLRDSNQLEYLRANADLDSIQDPSTRQAMAEALTWCLDLVTQGESPDAVGKRIKVGDQTTLLTAAGAHLLTGHVGKGQQFDWVWIVGVEQGVMPFFKAITPDEISEEARVFSVMASRARHGLVASYADTVPTLAGQPRGATPSQFLAAFNRLSLLDSEGIKAWFAAADWEAIGNR
jgi:DNA helicase-2/ATP-dependent DNA helicase PcrA